MSKRFKHLGREWEAFGTGTGRGTPSPFPKPADKWGVVFRAANSNGEGDYRASISEPDPSEVPESELKGALEEQLVLAAINRSRYVWRPAEAITRDTGIPIERVQKILASTHEVVRGSKNSQGLRLYTTREHLANTASPNMREFFEVKESS